MSVTCGVIFLSALGLAMGTSCSESNRNNDLDACLTDIHAAGLNNTAFWFGTQYTTMCPQVGNRGPDIECYNPVDDTSANSIITRILGSSPNLDRYLEMEFTSPPDTYSGCGNTYTINTTWTRSIDPLEDVVVSPWHTRLFPHLDWTSSPGELFTLVVYDVGYLFVHGVYVNIVGSDVSTGQTVKSYVGPQITTSLRNPYIFMLFKQSGQLTVSQEWRNRIEQNIAGNVTIPDLTADWNLGLVAMNWIVATGDVYAAQRKLEASDSNTCPDFVAKALSDLTQIRRPFLPSSPSFKVGVHVKFNSLATEFSACCSKHTYQQRSFYLNPLGNPVYDSYETSHRPVVSFVKKGFYEQMRNFAGDRYTLIVVDPDVPIPTIGTESKPLLHWLVANINNGDISTGTEYVTYNGPQPPDRKTHYYYFLLYKHESAIPTTSISSYAGSCQTSYEGRCLFNVNGFVSTYSLQLVGASWFTATTDIYVAYRKTSSGGSLADWCVGMPGYRGDPTCPSGKATMPHSSSLFILSVVLFVLFQ